MSLTAELAAFRAEFMGAAPPEIRDAMGRADLDLAASGVTERAPKALCSHVARGCPTS